MAATTFTWLPNEGGEAEVLPSVDATKFGDGYEQRVRRGINSIRQKWNLVFTGNMQECAVINAFLTARGGSEAFNWTTPLNVAGIYVCKTWKMTKISPGIIELSAQFEQVFEV